MPEEVTCIMCPLGCSVEVQIDGQEVSVKKGCRCKDDREKRADTTGRRASAKNQGNAEDRSYYPGFT